LPRTLTATTPSPGGNGATSLLPAPQPPATVSAGTAPPPSRTVAVLHLASSAPPPRTPVRRAGRGILTLGAPALYFAEDDLADERDRLTREDLEAMRQEFGTDVWHAYGRPFELDDDLHQVRQIEWAGITLDEWAKARGVPLTYAKALRRFLQQR
jgi:hypothetical protein